MQPSTGLNPGKARKPGQV